MSKRKNAVKSVLVWAAMLGTVSALAVGVAAAVDRTDSPATPTQAETHGHEHPDGNYDHDAHGDDDVPPLDVSSLDDSVTVSNDAGVEIEMDLGALLDEVNQLDENDGLPDNQHYSYGVTESGELGPIEICTIEPGEIDGSATSISMCEPIK